MPGSQRTSSPALMLTSVQAYSHRRYSGQRLRYHPDPADHHTAGDRRADNIEVFFFFFFFLYI